MAITNTNNDNPVGAQGNNVPEAALAGTAMQIPIVQPIGEQQIHELMQILTKYRSGKNSVDSRIIAAENWWKLRNDVEEGKDGHGKEGFRAKSGWLHNVITNKHADMMDAYPEPNILPREEGDKLEAAMLSKIIPVVLEKNQFEATYNKVTWSKGKTGTGVYKVIWDKDKLNGLGDISVTKCNILMYKAAMRSTVQNKGTGWGLLDISTLSAIQMLILIEFANNNVQQTIGYGYSGSYSGGTTVGKCDNVPNLTGTNSTSGGNVVWRGIEDVWGNFRTWIDGFWYYDGNYYVSNNPSEYAQDYSVFNRLSYSITTQYSGTYYITQLGLDSNYPYIMLPIAYRGGSATTYMCDTTLPSANSGALLYAHGGGYDDDAGTGLFFAVFQSTDNSSSSYEDGRSASRIMYIPQ